MLSKLFAKVKHAFTPETEHEALDAFITAQHPTSVYDVEYWIQEYDRKQYTRRSANFSYLYR